MARTERIRVPVHYDFASSLCFVAHRVLGRMADFLDEIDVELVWTPLDLTRLTAWRPGAPIAADRRAEIREIAAALDVPMQVPVHWADSIAVGAATVALLDRDPEAAARVEPAWRERVFTAVYEQGRACDDPALVGGVLEEMGLTLSADERERGEEALHARTVRAAEASVTAVPTLMLGPWPLSGVHEEATFRSLLGRFVARQRAVR